MNVEQSMCASSGLGSSWDRLDWSAHERQVRRLQARKRAWILAPAAALCDLLKLTWGFTGFMRADAHLSVILIATDDRPAADWLTDLNKAWQEVSGDTELRERLSLLRGFNTRNALAVATARVVPSSRSSPLLNAACERGGLLLLADEMHNLASSRLGATMTEVAKLCCYRIGLSATPEIEGDFATTERLLNYFGLVCASYELKNGIEDGVLCPYRYFPRPSYLSAAVGEKYLTLLRQIEDSPSNSSSLLDLYRQSRELVRTSGVQISAFKELLPLLKSGQRPLSHTLVYCPPGYGSYGGDQSDEIDTDESERRLLEEVVA